LFPTTIATWAEFAERARIGGLAGQSVIVFVLVFLGTMITIGILTVGMHQATGEVLPRFSPDISIPFSSPASNDKEEITRPWYRLSRRRQQLLAMVITDRAQAVSENILKEMKRGVTALQGTGMFTGKSHSLLICALTVTEVSHLKALVREADPQAFMIVSPAQEVLGRGFIPLDEK